MYVNFQDTKNSFDWLVQFFIKLSNIDFHDHVNEYPHLDLPCL